MGWFYGFKWHLIVNHQGGIVAVKVPPANVHETKPVGEIVNCDMNKPYADKRYISKALSSELQGKGDVVLGLSDAVEMFYLTTS